MHRDFRSLSAACQRIVSNFGAEVDLELRLAILRRENSRNSVLRGAEKRKGARGPAVAQLWRGKQRSDIRGRRSTTRNQRSEFSISKQRAW
jgi:hypothetical protein